MRRVITKSWHYDDSYLPLRLYRILHIVVEEDFDEVFSFGVQLKKKKLSHSKPLISNKWIFKIF